MTEPPTVDEVLELSKILEEAEIDGEPVLSSGDPYCYADAQTIALAILFAGYRKVSND